MTFNVARPVVVVDASVAIPFLEADPDCVRLWTAWVEGGAMLLAPAALPFEVANGLLRGGARRPISDVLLLVQRLFESGIEVTDRRLFGIEGALRLADRHGLTVYDAAYLDLAIDVDGEIATRDSQLRAAAEAEGVALAA